MKKVRVGGIVAWALAALGGAPGGPALAVGDETVAKDSAPSLEIDRDRGEVRFPCRFVNPTRVLEVFACHRTGPTHETVIEFDVTGPAIYRALVEIGCRNASHWNGTSPDDFEKNQGDRLLVLVRWEHAGKRQEHPAEGMLTDGETGFPSFVRGFSFGARGAPKVLPPREGANDEREDDDPESGANEEDHTRRDAGAARRDAAGAKETGVPIAVEVSLGASLRQTQPRTILSHPTSSVRVQPWMLAPFLDTTIVEEHRELVEKAVPATLILRRVRSEASVVEAGRGVASRRGLADAEGLYDRIEPIAREIDALKAEYDALLASLRGVIEEGARSKDHAEDRQRALGEQAKNLLVRGQWLCVRIEERYLSMYALEEAYKARWIEKRRDLPPEVREEALVLARDGFRFEPLIARLEVEQAALELPAFTGPPGEKKLRRERLSKEIEVVQLERSVSLARANVRHVEAKIGEVKDTDPYVTRLYEEDRMRAEAAVKQYDARRRVAWTEKQELQGILDGTWDQTKAGVLKDRAAARRELERARLEDELINVLEEIRWAEGDAASDDRERIDEAKKKLVDLLEKRRELEKKLAR